VDDFAPDARLVCYLSEAGRRDAARQGVQTARRAVHHLDPDDEYWEEFFALEPVLLYQGDLDGVDVNRNPVVAAEIVVGSPIRYSIQPIEPAPGSSYAAWEELLLETEVWRRPSVEIIYGSNEDVGELDRYLSVSELLDYEDKLREGAGRSDAEGQLRTVLSSWRRWVKTKGAKHVADLAGLISQLLADRDLPWEDKKQLKAKTTEFRRFTEQIDLADTDDRAMSRIMDMVSPAYEAAGEAAAAVNRRKEQRAELEEAKSWVQEHGSARLRKALAAELLSSAMGAYRDERLAYEHPGGEWSWVPRNLELKNIVNPSEEALDALLMVQQRDADARLRFKAETRTPVITSTFLGRQIYALASSVLDARREENHGHESTDVF
jgi:hypothetical protein